MNQLLFTLVLLLACVGCTGSHTETAQPAAQHILVTGCHLEPSNAKELPIAVYSLESERLTYEAIKYDEHSCNAQLVGTEYRVNFNMLVPLVGNNSADDWLHIQKVQTKR